MLVTRGAAALMLLMQRGPEAVRELVARRIPLYRYVMENTVSQFDLDRADGRVAAIRAAAPLVTSIRDQSLVCYELSNGFWSALHE
jgi:DNA primase